MENGHKWQVVLQKRRERMVKIEYFQKDNFKKWSFKPKRETVHDRFYCTRIIIWAVRNKHMCVQLKKSKKNILTAFTTEPCNLYACSIVVSVPINFKPYIFISFQVLGRNLALFVLIGQTPAVQSHHVIWWLFLSWSAVELVR